MSDGALRIPITGDASQFKATLAEIESSLKYFKEKLKSAKGDQVAKINFTIAGLEESKTAITTFGKFAEGTLGALNQQISELNRKKLTIQADAAALAPINQELDRLIKKRDELNKAGLAQPIIESVRPAAESIAGLRLRIQELNDLKILIDPKLNPSALAKINKEIDGLEDKVSNLDNLGSRVGTSTTSAAGGLKKFEDQSRQSRIAVTNLALVLQDLPFGFIAIQNNLPNLQSSFANLKASSDGVKGALQSFSSALIGPGGFFLAFSAVTGAVTYAVQKYGSLSAALDVLTSKNRIATEAQLEFNKAVSEESSNIGGRISQIKILVENYQKESATQAERLAAFRALKDINPDIVAGIDEQNFATAASIKLVGQNAQAVINLIKVQTQQKGILKALDGLEEKRFAANGKYNAARAKQIELESRLAKIDAKKSAGKALTSQERSLDVQRELARGEYAQSVKEASDEIAGITTQADKWYNSLKPLVTETSNADSEFETFRKTLEEFRKAQKAAAKGTKEFNFTEITKKAIPFFDLLSKVDVTEKDALKFFDFDIYKEFAQQYLSENDIKKLKKLQEQRIKKVFEIRKYKDTVPQLPDVTPRVTLSPLSREMAISREEMIKDFENTKIILDEVFFAPLSDLFQNFFDTGKFAFEDFGKSILNTIKSLVSKIIATGIINLLANILFPGGGVASSAFGGANTGAGKGILGAFGAAFKSVLGIGKIANPNFGGVQGGGMQLAGEVVFRQRGSDLIGVINRTNGTINRVG